MLRLKQVLFSYLWKIVSNTMLHIILQYGWEPVLIQRILMVSCRGHISLTFEMSKLWNMTMKEGGDKACKLYWYPNFKKQYTYYFDLVLQTFSVQTFLPLILIQRRGNFYLFIVIGDVHVLQFIVQCPIP